MKTLSLIVLIAFSQTLWAYDSDEIAYLLNQEMETLMQSASKPKVWAQGSLPPRDQRSGPAPSQMQGIENLEERFFSDEVSFQAARSIEAEDEAPQKESRPKSSRLRARPDGTVGE